MLTEPEKQTSKEEEKNGIFPLLSGLRNHL